jgi:hypothetical protein
MIDRSSIEKQGAETAARGISPVFILGCPRSGTTVLYHMLLSAGNFAVYRTESNVFNLLAPKFGGMRSLRDREALMQSWLRSKLFRVSGLAASTIQAKILNECHSGGDFLRIMMEQVCQQQGVRRWADCTPEHVLYIDEIKRQIPNAMFVHIIRDGRDVALSYVKQGWAYPLPWDKTQHLSVAGLYWQWLVKKGREYGASLGEDYREVRFEDLVSQPRKTLDSLSEFLRHDLDYDRIRQTAIGSVGEPNTSFADETDDEFNPVERWKSKMSPAQVEHFEDLLGSFLQELGYPLGSAGHHRTSLLAARLRSTYIPLFEAKQWIKTHTAFGRLVKLGRIQMEE